MALDNKEQWGSSYAHADTRTHTHTHAQCCSSRVDRDRHFCWVPCFYSRISRQWGNRQSEEAPTRCMIARLCGVVGPKEQLCLGPLGQSSLALCGIAWLSARPGHAQRLNRRGFVFGTLYKPPPRLPDFKMNVQSSKTGSPVAFHQPFRSITLTSPPHQRLYLVALPKHGALFGCFVEAPMAWISGPGVTLQTWHWSGREAGRWASSSSSPP